jgi:hypothetical protein
VQATGASRGGKTAPFGHQEPIGSYAQGGVMVKSAPASPFIMTETQFLLEFFIIPLDDPAMFGQAHQVSNFGLRGERG